MAVKVKAIPPGYEGAVPYICCKGAAKAIDFYKKAFGAAELYRMGAPGGLIGHAEVKIGGAIIMLADEYPDMGFLSPQTIGGTSVNIYIYVEDVDAVAKQAIDAGAKVLRPLTDQFYGDRNVQFEDPFGHRWSFGTHVEDVPFEEIQRRAAALYGGG
jgi:PhnB protein